MDILSELHFDALSKIIHVAAECAFQALSNVIGESVHASTPHVELITSENVSATALHLNAEKFGVVTETFFGAFNAELMMLFTAENALHIVQNMMGEEMDIDMVHEVEHEAMGELGNIMINAYLSSIADALHIPIESSLPCYAVKSSEEVVDAIQQAEIKEFILAAHIGLIVKSQPIEGKLFLLTDSNSISGVINEINQFIG